MPKFMTVLGRVIFKPSRTIKQTVFFWLLALSFSLAACTNSSNQSQSPSTAIPSNPAASPDLKASPANVSMPEIETFDGITFKTKIPGIGYIDGVNNSAKSAQTITKGTPIQINGWAVWSDGAKTQPANFVVLAIGEEKAPLAIVPINQIRPDIAKGFKDPVLEKSGWIANIDSAKLPNGTTVLKAWVYNPETKEALPLDNTFELVVK